MIINWKKLNAGVLVLPCLNAQRRVIKHIRLIPGHNQIKEKDYNQAINAIEKYVKNGIMEIITEEIEEKSIKPVKKGKKRKTVITTKKVKNISKIKKASKVLKIVQDTWDIETLELWREKEGRDEIRAAIANQIILVNKPPVTDGKSV